jgi:exodeoxyribonuclease VII large subunit
MGLETSAERPAPLRQIAQAVAGWVDRLGAVWVEGQITQVNRPSAINTVFITLRDSLADVTMTVTCPRAVVDSADPPVVEGASVVVHGRPRYFAQRGSFSLAADEIRMVGLGELLARLERRRQLLAAEGLFAAELKRRLPFLPRRIGLVTAEGSAAERDVKDNARRRWPAVEITCAYASMQGTSCVREVVDALQRLDRDPDVDVIVVARGGGSVEDLLPFSDETMIRTVAAVRTPVVSAIGHEPDTPLLDLVADVRASTPTDAAKHVVPEVSEEQRRIAELRDRGRRFLWNHVASEHNALQRLRDRPCLAAPTSLLEERSDEVDQLLERSRRCLGRLLDRAADVVDHTRARVRALSPLETLRRGYAVLQDADGHVLTDPAEVAPGAAVSARLHAGRLALTVADRQHPDPDPDPSADPGAPGGPS